MVVLALLGFGLVAVAVAVSTVLGARRKAVASGDCDSDSQSFVGGVFNALFTVVLAFYIVFTWQNGDDIEKATKKEANALADIHWQVEFAPPASATQIQALTSRYAGEVIDHEWSALDNGDRDAEVTRLINGMRGAVLSMPANDPGVKSTREQGLQNIRRIDEAHRDRVDVATDDQNFNLVLLAGSALGAVLMIVFPLVVGLSMRPANVICMLLLTCVLGLTISLAVELLYPLHGPFSVDPEALQDVRGEFASGPGS